MCSGKSEAQAVYEIYGRDFVTLEEFYDLGKAQGATSRTILSSPFVMRASLS